MARHNRSTLEARIAARVAELSFGEQAKLLLTLRAGSVGRWAITHGYHPEQVYMTLAGTRPYPEIRDALADELGFSREALDRLIEGTDSESGKDRKAA